MDEIKPDPMFLHQVFDVRIVPLTQFFVAPIRGNIPDWSRIHMRILRDTRPGLFYTRKKNA